MTEVRRDINISPGEYEKELIPALLLWQAALKDREVNSQLWFLFGSVVNQPRAKEPEDPIKILARELMGVRGADAHNFREESDIDVGVVVDDGQDNVDLQTNDPRSIFRICKVGGHVLSLTRFTASWIERRSIDIEKVKSGEPTDMGIYGRIIPIDL